MCRRTDVSQKEAREGEALSAIPARQPTGLLALQPLRVASVTLFFQGEADLRVAVHQNMQELVEAALDQVPQERAQARQMEE